MEIICLKTEGHAVVVTISDDGVGFPETKKTAGNGGLGMHTMHYRARIIGATHLERRTWDFQLQRRSS